MFKKNETFFVQKAAQDKRENISVGIAWFVSSVFLFSVMAVLAKILLVRYSVAQIVFFRFLFTLLPLFLGIVFYKKYAVLKTQRPFAHLFRTIFGIFGIGFSFKAVSLLPLAEATLVSFISPLFLTLLAYPLLHEKVGLHRALAVMAGFLGVIVIANPANGLGAVPLGIFVAICAAFFQALARSCIRALNRTESSLTSIIYFTGIATLLSLLVQPFVWITPTPLDMSLLCLIGLVGGLAQYSLIQAFQYAPVSVMSPFAYSSIVWSTLFGYLIWGETLTLQTILGGLIVVASGLYIFTREKKPSPVLLNNTAG